MSLRKDTEHESTLIAAATEYLRAGLSVMALSGKSPNATYHRHGLNEALVGVPEGDGDAKLVATVFGDPATTGIGIPIPDHVCVVDLDSDDGARWYLGIVGVDHVPDTPTARTARGMHIWFLSPRILRSAKIAPGADFRGQGGYVVVPPSRHPSGATYEWLTPLVQDGEIREIDWLPDGIEVLLGGVEVLPESPPEFRRMVIDTRTWQLVEDEPDTRRLVGYMAVAPEGQRNAILNWAAHRFKDDGVPRETCLKDLGDAAVASGLTAKEVRATIRSVYRRGDGA